MKKMFFLLLFVTVAVTVKAQYNPNSSRMIRGAGYYEYYPSSYYPPRSGVQGRVRVSRTIVVPDYRWSAYSYRQPQQVVVIQNKCCKKHNHSGCGTKKQSKQIQPKAGWSEMRDKNGKTVLVLRDENGKILQVLRPVN